VISCQFSVQKKGKPRWWQFFRSEARMEERAVTQSSEIRSRPILKTKNNKLRTAKEDPKAEN
jgi:hypothetical protein